MALDRTRRTVADRASDDRRDVHGQKTYLARFVPTTMTEQRKDSLGAIGVYVAYVGAVVVPVAGLVAGLVYLLKRSPDEQSAQTEMRHGFLLILVSLIMCIVWYFALT